MTTNRILVPSEGLFFLETHVAQMFAIEALLVSVFKPSLRFYDVYCGLTSSHLSAWIENRLGKVDPKEEAVLRVFLRRCEKSRVLLHIPENDPNAILLNEVFPVGQMVHEIMKGRTKEDAILITQRTFLGAREHKTEEEKLALPKSTRQLSKRTLERKWEHFESVLHYAGLYTINHVRVVAGEEQIPCSHGEAFFEEMSRAFQRSKGSRKIRIPEPVFLEFCNQIKFSNILFDFPPVG